MVRMQENNRPRQRNAVTFWFLLDLIENSRQPFCNTGSAFLIVITVYYFMVVIFMPIPIISHLMTISHNLFSSTIFYEFILLQIQLIVN